MVSSISGYVAFEFQLIHDTLFIPPAGLEIGKRVLASLIFIYIPLE